MKVLDDRRGRSALVRLRSADVVVDVDIDACELEMRDREAVDLAGLDHGHLGALLAVPRWERARFASLPSATKSLVRRRPDLVELGRDGYVTRRVGPPLWVDMVTLPTERWRTGLRTIGRFAPYSARQLQLDKVPRDVDDLCVEATYWGVGVCVAGADGVRQLVEPEPFVPERFTGASWAFAEQTLSAVRAA